MCIRDRYKERAKECAEARADACKWKAAWEESVDLVIQRDSENGMTRRQIEQLQERIAEFEASCSDAASAASIASESESEGCAVFSDSSSDSD